MSCLHQATCIGSHHTRRIVTLRRAVLRAAAGLAAVASLGLASASGPRSPSLLLPSPVDPAQPTTAPGTRPHSTPIPPSTPPRIDELLSNRAPADWRPPPTPAPGSLPPHIKPLPSDRPGGPAPRGAGNDECTTPAFVSGSPVAFPFNSAANTTGTSGQGEPDCIFFGSSNIDLDEWVVWTANASGAATVSTCGGSTVDTKIAVWDSAACPPTAIIACNDDSCGLQSSITFACTACGQYLIQVGVFPGSAGGPGILTITGPAGSSYPPNDDCANATLVTDGTFNYDLTCATNDWPGTCGATSTAEDVWYQYISSCSGIATVSTCGLSAGDSVLSILDECGGPQILCLDDSCGLQTQVSFAVVAGEDYYIRIAEFAGGQHAGQFSVSCALPPSNNDSCAGALPISEACWYEYDNAAATTDGLPDPLCFAFGFDDIERDLWYIWGGTCDGPLTIETCGGSNRDTKIAVYDNGLSPVPSCPTAAPLACNDDTCGLQSRVQFTPTAGHFYLLRIGNYIGSQAGPAAFRVVCPPCIDLDCQPGTVEEAEVCGADTNGGCNSLLPGAYQLIPCSQRLHGTSFALAGTRDTDWYRVVASPAGVISVTFSADFDCVGFILDLTTPIPFPCATITVLAMASAPACQSAALTAVGLVPGNSYVVFIAPGNGGGGIFDGIPCTANYVMDVDVGAACPYVCPDATASIPDSYVFEIGGVTSPSPSSFPWTISFPDAPGCLALSGVASFPENACAAIAASDLAASIQSQAVNASVAHIVRARSVPGGQGCAEAYVLIDVFGSSSASTAPLVFCAGAPLCCIPPTGTCIPAPLSSPSIAAVSLLCTDCDANGVDDRVDVLTGRLTDFNSNGLFDQCEGLSATLVPSPLGFNVSAINAALALGPGNSINWTAPDMVERGLLAMAPGFESFGFLAGADLAGAVANVSDIHVRSTGVVNMVPNAPRGVVRVVVENPATPRFQCFADYSAINATDIRVVLLDADDNPLDSAVVANDLATALASFTPELPEIEIDSVIQHQSPCITAVERGAVLRFAGPVTAEILPGAHAPIANVRSIHLVASGAMLASLGDLSHATFTARRLPTLSTTRMHAGAFGGVRVIPDPATAVDGSGVGVSLSSASDGSTSEYGAIYKFDKCALTVDVAVAALLPDGPCPSWHAVLCGKTCTNPHEEKLMDPLDIYGGSKAVFTNPPLAAGFDIFVPLCTKLNPNSASSCGGNVCLECVLPVAPTVSYRTTGGATPLTPTPLGGKDLVGSVSIPPTGFVEDLVQTLPCITVIFDPANDSLPGNTVEYYLGSGSDPCAVGSLTPCVASYLEISFVATGASGFSAITAIKVSTSNSSSSTLRAATLTRNPPSEDQNNDCAITSQDFFDFLALFFSGSALADFNCSGGINAQDFFDFLTCFFGGC